MDVVKCGEPKPELESRPEPEPEPVSRPWLLNLVDTVFVIVFFSASESSDVFIVSGRCDSSMNGDTRSNLHLKIQIVLGLMFVKSFCFKYS